MRQSTFAASNLAIQVRLKPDLVSAIESFRRGESDIPSRPEAIRRILQRALIRAKDEAQQ
jgi:metal-responsive CopG/Arc/MetJ family transcriptional regulator